MGVAIQSTQNSAFDSKKGLVILGRMARQQKTNPTPKNAQSYHHPDSDLPAWLRDTDYNGMVFRVRQAFFPRTGA